LNCTVGYDPNEIFGQVGWEIIHAMVHGSGNSPWLATDKGLVHFNNLSGKFTRSDSHKEVFSIAKHQELHFWIGPAGGGLFLLSETELKAVM